MPSINVKTEPIPLSTKHKDILHVGGGVEENLRKIDKALCAVHCLARGACRLSLQVKDLESNPKLSSECDDCLDPTAPSRIVDDTEAHLNKCVDAVDTIIQPSQELTEPLFKLVE